MAERIDSEIGAPKYCDNCEDLKTELMKWKYLAKSFYETRFSWDNAEFEWACKRYEQLDK